MVVKRGWAREACPYMAPLIRRVAGLWALPSQYQIPGSCSLHPLHNPGGAAPRHSTMV